MPSIGKLSRRPGLLGVNRFPAASGSENPEQNHLRDSMASAAESTRLLGLVARLFGEKPWRPGDSPQDQKGRSVLLLRRLCGQLVNPHSQRTAANPSVL
jgi:hypothetical protein